MEGRLGRVTGRIKEAIANPVQFFPDDQLKSRLVSETENAEWVFEERERLRRLFNRALSGIVTVPGTHVIKDYISSSKYSPAIQDKNE